ncbi:MAG: molecular chaperone HscC [Ketobacteraceae bacterium]|nr:molecular chaperone HscC [Ketobacteraceae bacterium]
MAIIGIDLGTTNSLCCVWKDGKSQLIPNALGDYLTPSVVGLDDNGQLITGQPAKDRLQTHPDLSVGNFKRYMGTPKKIRLGKAEFRIEELAGMLLKSIKQDAEEALKEPVEEAVISVPAYFNDAQRKATRLAAQLAGLKVDRLINEPTAAAIAYGLHHQDDDSTFLVFDIGGGTFDVSVLELFSGVLQVHAAAGDNSLGGEDFLDVLLGMMLEQIPLDPASLDPKQLNYFRKQAETIKKMLSDQNRVEVRIKYNSSTHSIDISREAFQSRCDELLLRLRSPVERALKDSNIMARDLDAIVLVGGASRMPMIRSLCAKMFGKMPLMNVDPDQVVALGAGVLTGMLANDEALEEIVLTDVAPYTLGTNVVNHNDARSAGALFHPIIERNSPVPVSRSEILYTASDYQKKIVIGIYQGEARLARDNIKLGEITVQVPPKLQGEESVDVRFTYDVNGLLEVEVEVLSSKLKKRAVIEGNPGVMTPKEIEKALAGLASLKVHPRDQMENSALIARAERMYEESLGDRRAYLSELTSRFEAILDRQDPKEIEVARRQIGEILDEMEESPFI